jgi:hypothetical protein
MATNILSFGTLKITINNFSFAFYQKRYTGTHSLNFRPSFITGFSDAEASFLIIIKRSLNHKLGWRATAKFRIELHKKDLELLNFIQSYFKGIGQVGVISTRKLAYFPGEVTKLDDLVNIIIPHFDKYPLQSAKSIDYLLWKQCISLMVTKEHLTQCGLEKIISIKSAINWGNSESLILSLI